MPRIDDGKLEPHTIESYFISLIEDYKMWDSRHLVFFLTANKKSFDTRKERDTSLVKGLLTKIFNSSKTDMNELKIDDRVKVEVRFSLPAGNAKTGRN